MGLILSFQLVKTIAIFLITSSLLKIGRLPYIDEISSFWYDYRQKQGGFRQNRPISNPSGRVVAVAGIGVIFLAAMIPVQLLEKTEGIYGHADGRLGQIQGICNVLQGGIGPALPAGTSRDIRKKGF